MARPGYGAGVAPVRGMVVMATRRYGALLAGFVRSVADHGAADVVYCLTDDSQLLSTGPSRREPPVVHLPWGAPLWPYATLFRYGALLAYEDLFRAETDQLVHIDVDMRVVGPCDELFGPELVAVRHSWFFRSPPSEMPFETREESAAAVTPDRRRTYVHGAVQGGRTDTYLDAARACHRGIVSDHSRGVMAVWHDESHWNAHLSNRSDVTLLGPEFSWTERGHEPPPAPPRILVTPKDDSAIREFYGQPEIRARMSRAARHGLATTRHYLGVPHRLATRLTDRNRSTGA